MKIDAKAPLQIFLILEHLPLIFFTASSNSGNHQNYYITNNYLRLITVLISNEVTLNYSYLIEMSAVDFGKTSQTWFVKALKKISNQILLFSTYYFYWIKIKITFFTLLAEVKHKAFTFTTETIFFNANWLEREVSEMFGIYFFNKLDARNLLLEYSCPWNPMLKKFPCEGYFESYYNFFENNAEQLQVESVEL